MSIGKSKGAQEHHVACVWLPHFLWQLYVTAQPDLKGHPTILIGKDPKSSAREFTVLDHSPGLQEIHLGMPVSQAKSVYSRADFAAVDTLQAEDVFASIVQRLQDATPEIEKGEFGVAYPNLSGTERLYPSPGQAVAALAQTLEAEPFHDIRIGLGANKWLAYIAATKGQHRRARRVSGSPHDLLNPISIDLLPVPHELKERFRQFHFLTNGDLAAIPLDKFQAQFGAESRIAWELASGIDNRPFLPMKIVESISMSMDIDPPTIMTPTVTVALERLLSAVFADKRRKGRYVRKVIATLQCSDRSVLRVRAAFRSPVGSVPEAKRVLESKVMAVNFEAPVEFVHVSLHGLTNETARQISLLPESRHQDSLRDTFQQIKAALGIDVSWLKDTDYWSHLPEERTELVPASL